jgi:CheY-like chemotaxis protein
MMIENPIVLIVDDCEADVLLMRIVFERAGFVLPLQLARDGEEAISYLKGDGAYSNRKLFPLPTVMLLDLNMPRKNGFEVLTWIRRQPTLKRLRVYVLSESSRPEDIRCAYDLGANSYLVKPGNLEGLMQTAKILGAWLRRSHFAPLDKIGHGYEPAFTPVLIPRSDTPPAMPAPANALRTKGSASADEAALHEVCRQNKELQLRIKKQDAELNALREKQTNLMKIIRDDVLTPLMTVGGYTDLLLQSPTVSLDDSGRLYLLKITEATDHLTRTLGEIVSTSNTVQMAPFSNGNGVHANSVA